jgi:hypothetical protein
MTLAPPAISLTRRAMTEALAPLLLALFEPDIA